MSAVLLLVNGTLIACIFAAGRWLGGRDLSALQILVWQVLCASALVTVVAWWRGQRVAWTMANVRYAAIAGALGITIPGLVSFTALQRVPAGLVAAIAALSPILSCALAHPLGLRRPSPRQWLGVLVGACGLAMMLTPRAALPDREDLPWAMLAAVAPLSLALGNLYRSRAWPVGLSPLAAARVLLTIQAAVSVPLLLLGEVPLPPVWRFDLSGVVLWGAGLAAAWVYGTTFVLQRWLGPVAVGQLGNVTLATGVALGAIAFDERLTPMTLVAGAVLVAGVVLVAGAPAARARVAPSPAPGA